MNYSPLVSIIIPVYKGYPFLANAIESCINQTYKNIEIIVVNDGSPDNGKTAEIARSFGDKIRYFEKTNGGVSSALNKGIKEMKGEWFSWLSHDDLYLPEKIDKQIQAVQYLKDKCCVVRCTTMSVNVEEIPLFRPQRAVSGVFSAEKMMKLHSLQELGLYGCSLLIHKEILSECGFFNEELKTVQDEDYWNRIMFKGFPFISIPDVLIKIRIHENQTTNRLSDKFAPERLILANNAIEYFNENRNRNRSLLLTLCKKQYKERRIETAVKIREYLNTNNQLTILDKLSLYFYCFFGYIYSLLKIVYRGIFVKPNR